VSTIASTSQQARTRLTREQSRGRIVEATAELLRERSYGELNVREIMGRAGLERTIFYRHFDDLGDLLITVAREAITELYEAQVAMADARVGADPESVRESIAATVAIYSRHGPLLRALAEGAAVDPVLDARQAELRGHFDELVEGMIHRGIENGAIPPPDPAESARALNRLVEAYLLEAFGREPRISTELAVDTLSDIWSAFVARRTRN
jgi:TetR/AcrR family transcriptional regulator, ethionamide resistance regulator